MENIQKLKGFALLELAKRLKDDDVFELSKSRFDGSVKKIMFWSTSELMSRMCSIEGLRDTLLLGSKVAEHVHAMEKELGPQYKHQTDPFLTELLAMTPSGLAQLMSDLPAMGAAAEIHDLRTLSDQLFDAAKLCTISMQRAKELGETDERVCGFNKVAFPLQHAIRKLYPTLKL